MSLDLADIQGLIHHVYSYPKTRHLLFEIGNPAVGMSLLKLLAPRVTSAADPLKPLPESVLNVGITYRGLEALEVNAQFLKRSPSEFRDEPDRVTMGDFGASDPGNCWNGKFQTQQVYLVVHLYGQSLEALDKTTAEVREMASGNQELIPTESGGVIEVGFLVDTPGELHFGYHDGISQPTVRWDDGPLQPGEVDYRHFILGYATREIPSAPLEFASDPNSSLAAELGRNGTYSVFRWLYQDVAGFNQFLETEGPKAFPELSSKDAEELLAAKLMGRWRDGRPLVMSPITPNQVLSRRNDFDYANDLDGRKCPFSAHIRVTNPRNQELDDTSTDPGGVPRVIRRGAPYGPKFMAAGDEKVDRGLVGMFLCASIVRQFYKQAIWMKENNFSRVFPNQHAQDPLANRLTPNASNQFLIPMETSNRTVTLQDFVTTKDIASASFIRQSPDYSGLCRFWGLAYILPISIN
jgi:deferrochelatase/peroxidase EfeB